jgi:hypothetical protein
MTNRELLDACAAHRREVVNLVELNREIDSRFARAVDRLERIRAEADAYLAAPATETQYRAGLTRILHNARKGLGE